MNCSVGEDGIHKLAFAWKCFLLWFQHVNADDDPDNRVECGGKEQAGTLFSSRMDFLD